MSQQIYLDHAASSPDKSIPYINTPVDSRWNGNSHSIHESGRRSDRAIVEAEETLKDAINGWSGEFHYFGSGSQANNSIVESVAVSNTLLTTEIEHKSLLQHVEKYAHGLVPPDHFGQIRVDQVQKRLMSYTDLVSVQMVNNETGSVQPIAKIGRALPQDVYFHSDAVQAFGKIPIDVEAMGLDALTLSSHKVNGPKGLGLLWIRHSLLGNKNCNWNYQGTPPTELICRLAYVMSNNLPHLQWIADYIAKLEMAFMAELFKSGEKFEVNAPKQRMTGILSLCFKGVDGDELLFDLDTKGVYVSNGSACGSKGLDPSHVLTAIGLSDEDAMSTIRVSFSYLNTIDEVVKAATIIGETVKELRNGS